MKTRVVTTRAPHPNAFLQVPVGTEITVHWPTLSDINMNYPTLPEASLFTHQTLTYDRDNQLVPSGVHLGVNSRTVCEQAHMEGETHTEIHEWFSAEQMRAYAAQAVAQYQKENMSE